MKAEELKSQLESFGCRLFLEGDDNIRFRFAGKQIPDNAKPLLHELKIHKSEVVNILKADNIIALREIGEAEAIVMAEWPPEMRELIIWFMELEPPTEPFYLEPYIHVIDPEKFFASLKREIASGHSCPRGRNGALLYDLNKLRKFIH